MEFLGVTDEIAEKLHLVGSIPNGNENGHVETEGGLRATPLRMVIMRSIEWLEKPLWQASAFQLLAGAKGAGKGTYLAGLAARISLGGRNVLFVSSEDSVSIDLKPRLVAAGADQDRCFVITLDHVRLPEDIGR